VTASADVLVVGAGAVGTSTARALAREGLDVVVLEKETGPALHQSGRNSGVVHAGYQYEPGSTKARFATEGARRLVDYCRERGVPVRQDGLLVVATDDGEQARLEDTLERAEANGVEAELVGPDRLREIEPHAGGQAAIHVPSYASFDARAYVHSLYAEAVEAGATVLFDTRVERLRETPDGVEAATSKGPLVADAAVNAAGLHADRLAEELCEDLRVVPFRGYYAELVPDRRDLVNSHVYPAPDPELPFLGVHFSRRADGRVIVGPGAMLAFGREAYSFWGVDARDLWDTLSWAGFWRLVGSSKIRSLVGREVKKSLSLRALAKEARRLVPEVTVDDLVRSYAGNRAQMVSRDGDLVMDLVVRATDRCVHVLNAISPGLTCSLPFGEHLAEQVLERV
jgi:L-2-hydroxyglutarate oxidase